MSQGSIDQWIAIAASYQHAAHSPHCLFCIVGIAVASVKSLEIMMLCLKLSQTKEDRGCTINSFGRRTCCTVQFLRENSRHFAVVKQLLGTTIVIKLGRESCGAQKSSIAFFVAFA